MKEGILDDLWLPWEKECEATVGASHPAPSQWETTYLGLYPGLITPHPNAGKGKMPPWSMEDPVLKIMITSLTPGKGESYGWIPPLTAAGGQQHTSSLVFLFLSPLWAPPAKSTGFTHVLWLCCLCLPPSSSTIWNELLSNIKQCFVTAWLGLDC